eukprot:TRINITY_DN219_c0_g1_i2.p1 TRINITY_DN219_c0_g1~~TRINITY_DN219_c0_g1_i2.p1  ORF type:complete len:424 (-),score=98.89 TRINITY_DN219_c0_g1_i2:68-1288(-)
MSNQAASAGTDKKKEEKIQYPPPNFEIESYLSQYKGHGRISRLKYIGEHCKELSANVFKQCLEELKKTTNTGTYQEVCKAANLPVDTAWVDAMDRKSQILLEKLEMELNGYKTNLVKESIRMGHNDLGDFQYERGDLNSALKCYVRTRDYCTTPQHILDMCLKVVRVSIEMGNYAHVSSYVTKAESTPELTDPVTIAKLNVAAGLSHLSNRKYLLAAKKFMAVTDDLGTTFNEILSMNDVAIYGALCALATFDRQQLKDQVIDNNGAFKNLLELVPAVREMIGDFYNSRYAQCFTFIDKLKNDIQLDVFLSPHARTLLNEIRHKALIQYFTPYQSADIKQMASAFNTTVQGMERELALLIMDGQIHARIDPNSKILYGEEADVRNAAFEAALKMDAEFEEEAKRTY